MAFALRVNVKYIHFGYPAEMWAGVRGLRAVCFTPLPFPLPSRARGEETLVPLSWRIAFSLNNTSLCFRVKNPFYLSKISHKIFGDFNLFLKIF